MVSVQSHLSVDDSLYLGSFPRVTHLQLNSISDHQALDPQKEHAA